VDGGWGFVSTLCEDCKTWRRRYPVAREPKWIPVAKLERPDEASKDTQPSEGEDE
jgi:hypothetical protein